MNSQFIPDETLTREAVALAARLLQEAQHDMTRQEQRQAWESHFGVEHDPSQVLDASNVSRYRPIQSLTLRFTAADAPTYARMPPCAAQVCGAQAANAHHVHIVDVPVVHNGRLELRRYLREQSIAYTIHRYGNIMQLSR